MKKIIWGTGINAQKLFNIWRLVDCYPAYFCDNNVDRQNKKFNDIEVLPPNKILCMQDIKIYIACESYEEIYRQIIDTGFPYKNIIIANSLYLAETFYDNSDKIVKNLNNMRCNGNMYECVFDLSFGMLLGGVETWSYQMADNLFKKEVDVAYLSSKMSEDKFKKENFKEIYLSGKNFLEECIRFFIFNDICLFVGNFPYEIFQAACLVKKYYRKDMKIFAVIHNDEALYYKIYSLWSNQIDEFFVISRKIKEELFEYIETSHRVNILNWTFQAPTNMFHKNKVKKDYISIGYAGRIVKDQKRLDLFIEVANILKKEKIKFIMQLAGQGTYMDELKRKIEENDLKSQIQLLGYIPNNKIFKFWSDIDIYLSCSEYEGHSISQVEAMMMGAVPVVTRTSGVEDDIEHGKTGFIVEIGEVSMLAKHIIELANNKKLFFDMSRAVSKSISKKNKQNTFIEKSMSYLRR
ncbi:hypothetical protein CIRMBP1197_00716 [Enterococcus cecorum]|nr:hypothetical protein CIRMBP1197_00716 [Enterococcus cecorum]